MTILTMVWVALSAVAFVASIVGLRFAYCDRVALREDPAYVEDGRRDLVAKAHVREEATMLLAQSAFLCAGILRLSLGPPPTEDVSIYRTITTFLFFAVQVLLVANSVARRRARVRLLHVVSQNDREPDVTASGRGGTLEDA